MVRLLNIIRLTYAGVVVWICISGSFLIAGTTGKITGLVLDASTGEPLIGANIIIEGTSIGAATDIDGRYIILNIPPAVYDVKSMMIGYTSVRTVGIKISIDVTTTLHFQLQPSVLEFEEVTIIAERKIVRKDLTSTLSIVGSDEIAEMPVEEFEDILALQAGIIIGAGGEIHIRGGRSSEISYLVDGISVTDPFSGELAIEIENNSIQELQVISGTFNAEYGQAMSGIIDIVTKDGGDRLRGNISFYSGDYLSRNNNLFMNIDNVNNVSNVQISMDGPLPLFGNKLSFFLTGRYYNTQGWLYGKRRFLPSDSSNFANWDVRKDDVGADSTANTGDAGEGDGSATPGEPNVYVEESGDGAFVAMNSLVKISAEGKLTYRLSPTIKVSYGFFWNKIDFREYSHLFKLNPDGDYQQFKYGYAQSLIWNHTLSSRTFYTLKLSDTFFDYQRYVYQDPLDSRYVDPKRLDDASQKAFKTGGTEMWHYSRNTRSFGGKADFTSQINNSHQAKIGLEFRQHNLYFHEFEIIPKKNDAGIVIRPFEPTPAGSASIANNRYRHHPVEAAAYIQDKMEFEEMIVNIGLRYDYFNANAKVPIDLRDPDNAKYFMVTSQDGISRMVREHEYGTEMGKIDSTVNVQENIWENNYRNAKPVHSLSPRFGISYPISDRGAIHFSYGHFSQIPTFEQLYDNSEFEVWPGLSSMMGNAELKPQRTVIYEIGLQQQLLENIGIDITGFYKDTRHLLGMEIINTYTQDMYARYINRDYGNVKGITFALEKRRSNSIYASVDYTYQVAEGNASDPKQVFKDAKSNKESEIQIVPLDWDQTHTLNFNISMSQPGNWGLSLIGRLGSGLPYTPKIENVGATFENSERKPVQYTFDLKVHKDFKFLGSRGSAYIKAYNILDRKNEVLVYSDTGRAGYTIKPHGSVKGVNTFEEFLNRPDYYSEPRRVIFGVSVGF
jgi:outer membrane receptor protein involved in Fe transport